MSVEVKYHLFYLKEVNSDRYSLYAYTDKKDMAKRFMKERNMDLFVYKKKMLNQEEIHNLAEFKLRQMLEIFEMDSKNENYEKCKVSLLVTSEEKFATLALGTTSKYGMIYRYTWEPYLAFKPKYIQALYRIFYIHLNEYISGGMNDFEYEDKLSEDLLGCFIHSYGYLLKKG